MTKRSPSGRMGIEQSRYDGQGRRVRKRVRNSGVHDGTTVYYYNGWQIVETRDGSGNLTMQAYHGTQYIDERAPGNVYTR